MDFDDTAYHPPPPTFRPLFLSLLFLSILALAALLTLALPGTGADAASVAPPADAPFALPQEGGGNDGNRPPGDGSDDGASAQSGAQAAQATAQSTTPTLTVSSITKNTATLTIDGHTGNWHYKADVGPDNTCQGPVSMTTESLTGLSGNTTYTYTAYSDSGCATQVAAASFTTYPILRVSDVDDITAKLFISGHTGDWYYQANAAPHTTCQGPVAAATSETLTGLTASATYTYTAYSDAGCTTKLAAASPFTTYAFPLDECHDLTLETYLAPDERQDAYYRVSNPTDETITNVKVVIKIDTPKNDSDSVYHYIDDGIKYSKRSSAFWLYADEHSPRKNGTLSFEKPDPSDPRTWATHWLMPDIRPGASHILGVTLATGSTTVRAIRNTVTMTQLVPYGTTALCQTERVTWARTSVNWARLLKPTYGVGLSVDNRRPAAGDTVNFKVKVPDVRYAYGVNARVAHTAGLALDTTSSVTPPAKTTWAYAAAKRQGDLFIGTENVNRSGNEPIPSYEITLPLRVQAGATLSEQCVTATITGFPEPAPRVLGHTGDDPSDNTATLCLGGPTAAQLPVLLTDGRADLLNLHGCVGKTAYPCDATDSVKLLVGGRDAAANAGMPYPYFEPEDVVVHIPDVASRNLHNNGASTFWWSGSDDDGLDDHGHSEGPHHPGLLPGVAAWTQYDCLTDKDPNNPPDDDPEYKGWKLAIADLTDGQGNTIDYTPGAMIISLTYYAKNPDFSYVDVDGTHGNNQKEVEYSTYKFCEQQFLLTFKFDKLGTYKADITHEVNYQGPPVAPYSDTGTYTFQVGPVAELAVSDSRDLPTLASGETAYTLDLTNHGPDAALAAKVAVKLPAGATQVRTVPANLGTWHAAGTTNGVVHTNPYWTWDAGVIAASGDFLSRSGQVTIVVRGVTAGDTATATVSNGNGECTASGQTAAAPFIIRESDCAAITGATWTLVNPYKVCIDSGADGTLANVYPNPFNETTCEATAGNEWHEGTVYDHRPGNNTATLTARTGGSAGLAGVSDSQSFVDMVLNWPSPSGAELYRVFRSVTGAMDSYRRIGKAKASAATYTDEAVTVGNTYHYLVEALARDGRLLEIYTASIKATAPRSGSQTPGTVGSLTAGRAAGNENVINVSWTAPSGSITPTGYDVAYQSCQGRNCSLSGAWTQAATEQAGSSYTLSNAGGGTKYKFRVRAVNRVGSVKHEGNWISPSSAEVGTVSEPGQVLNLTAARETNNDTSITVTWDAPTSTNTTPTPTHYDVQYQVDSGSWQPDTPYQQAAATNNSYSPSGVTGNHSYKFRVRAVTKSGGDDVTGPWRDSNRLDALAKPGQVSGLTATRQTGDETEIDVSWTAPGNATGQTTYEVQHKQDDDSAWKPATPTPVSTGTSYTLTGAAGGSKYVFQVRAVTTLTSNTRLEGDWRSSGNVAGLVAGDVTGLTAARETNGVADPYSTTITVTWNAAARATEGYDVMYRKNNGGWQQDNVNGVISNPNTLTYTHRGADGVETYTFRVRGVSKAGRGKWTESNTVPAPPVRYKGYDVGVDWFTLKVTSGPWWYDYRDHQANWSSCRRVASGGVTLTGLRPEKTYLVDVYTSSGGSANKIVDRASITTLAEGEHPDKCWGVADCRANDGSDFNYHTHKRSHLGEIGVILSGCNQGGKVYHNHNWTDGNGGWHWHCKTSTYHSSASSTAESGGGQAGGQSSGGQAGGASASGGQQQPAESQGQTQGASSYDLDGDGSISRDEALAALADYFAGNATRETATAVVMMYFASGS